MTKFPIMLYNTKNTKKALVPPIPPPSSYEDAVGWSAIEAGYKTALRGSRKFTREAVLYDLYSEVNNVRLWRDLKKIEKTRQAGVSEYTPGKYRHRIIVEPKERSLHIPPLRDKVVQLVIHQELQTLFRPVFVNRSFACMYGKGPIRAAFNVQHDMRVARMKWGDEATVIKIDVRKFFYSIDRSVLKQIIAKRFKKLKKKYPEKYEDFLRFYRLLCKVIDSSPEGERGIPLGNVSSQDFANIYLNELDQFCIRFLGATLYTRYMDDVVIIAPDKEIAREWLAKIKVFLQERLHLETKVVVSDGQGGTATRTWTFTRTNSAPTISGSDGNLGDKNLGFTYAYTIDDADGDTLTVVEELNDETIRTINNAPKGEELTVTITSEKLYALGLNSVNTLKITVTDGKGGTAYRRVTFKRTNSAPTISGQDKALGLKNGSFAENYTVSDVEGDNVVVTEFVDDVQIRSYQATLGQQETIELTREKWLSLTNGQHQLRIEAVDGNFATSVRVFSFSKKETVIKFELAAPEETDAAATKVLVTPTWKIEGAVAKVEACNNGFDAVPTWEDITAMVQINRVYNFTNKTKTASKWGVNIRFTITKNEGFEGEVSISGFGGAYE